MHQVFNSSTKDIYETQNNHMNLTHGLGIKASRMTFLIMIAGDTTLASPKVVANPLTPTPDRPHTLLCLPL